MIINVYKPKTWTSFDVVARLRTLLHTKKVGHAGTLDPLAQGVLIVLTEEDTKNYGKYMHTKKEYIADIALGLDSDSYDLGTPVYKHNKNITNFEDINLASYIGTLNQVVPSYSAVRIAGKRLYKSAREGTVDLTTLPSKNVEIFELEKLEEYIKDFGEFKNITVIKVRIACSSGFYVRSFAHDIGGVLVELLRTKVGDFKVEDSIKNWDSLVQP